MHPQAPINDSYDVLVVGGGPAGTTCGHLLAKRGWSVLIVEKAEHPRFQIGESLLPYSTRVWDELIAAGDLGESVKELQGRELSTTFITVYAGL